MSKSSGQLTSLGIGLLIFIILPILSWSPWAVKEFLAEPTRAAYCAVTLMLLVGVVLWVPDFGRSRRAGISLVPRQHAALAIMQVLSLADVAVPPFCDRRNIATFPDTIAIRMAGLLLFTFGYLLMNWAVMALDRQFSIEVTVQENHQLITSGPYRLIRHPRYLGILLFLAGMALIFRSQLGLAISALMLLTLGWRIYDEEKLLQRQFGSQWTQYAHKTRRLVPFLY